MLWPVASVWILSPICLLEVFHKGDCKEFRRLLRKGNAQKNGCGGLTHLTNIVGKASVFGKTHGIVLCDVPIEGSVIEALEMYAVDGIDLMSKLTKLTG